jgi:hypothetical protein
MRNAAILAALTIALGLCVFAYLTFFRPIDQPTSALRGLEAHLIASGIPGHIYPVRHGYFHSRMRAAAAFEIAGYPLPLVLLDCATEQEAAIFSASKDGLPRELQPVRNGTLVLDFPSWGDDTFPQAERARRAFLSFRREP